MDLLDYDFSLPDDLIASQAAEPRDSSRLMVIGKKTERIEHRHFFDLPKYLRSGDLLVVNNSRVFPARLVGQKAVTGGRSEILLEREIEPGLWLALGRNVKQGNRIIFPDSSLQAGIENQQEKIVEVRFNLTGAKLISEIEKIGQVPLPPYIIQRRNQQEMESGNLISDKECYQTVYAKSQGSVAAPTAGLHFTEELFTRLRQTGVEIAEVTLHVGFGTFQPVEAKQLKNKALHPERFSVGPGALRSIASAKENGRRVIAVGTTTTRVLEHLYTTFPKLPTDQEITGETNIFIQPGYQFQCIDGLITNFHLPKSSLIMLVAAFAGRELIQRAYRLAIREKYRFYSFGDAMIII